MISRFVTKNRPDFSERFLTCYQVLCIFFYSSPAGRLGGALIVFMPVFWFVAFTVFVQSFFILL